MLRTGFSLYPMARRLRARFTVIKWNARTSFYLWSFRLACPGNLARYGPKDLRLCNRAVPHGCRLSTLASELVSLQEEV
jgi:hypothetical protein